MTAAATPLDTRSFDLVAPAFAAALALHAPHQPWWLGAPLALVIGLRWWQRRQHRARTPTWLKLPLLVLLDLNMPVLDGYSVIRKIAADTAAYAKVKIVVVTGTMYNDFQKTGLDSHINGYVEKPVEKDELIGQIKKCATEF